MGWLLFICVPCGGLTSCCVGCERPSALTTSLIGIQWPDIFEMSGLKTREFRRRGKWRRMRHGNPNHRCHTRYKPTKSEEGSEKTSESVESERGSRECDWHEWGDLVLHFKQGQREGPEFTAFCPISCRIGFEDASFITGLLTVSGPRAGQRKNQKCRQKSLKS